MKLKRIIKRFLAIFGINIFPMSKIKKLSKTIIGIDKSTFTRDSFKSVVAAVNNSSYCIDVLLIGGHKYQFMYGTDNEFERNEDLETLRKFINS